MAKVFIEGKETLTLLDTGATINTVTPEWAQESGLPIHPMSDLVGEEMQFSIQGIGGLSTRPLGYVYVEVRVDGVADFKEQQVALVLEDNTAFARRVPIVLGTPTICRIVEVMKESELEHISQPWQNARLAHLLAVRSASGPVEKRLWANKPLDPLRLDEKVTVGKKTVVPPFSSSVLYGKADILLKGVNMNVITRAPNKADGNLPFGVFVTNVYTELHDGCKSVAVVVQNQTARPVTLKKGRVIARVEAANKVPPAQMIPGTLEKLDELEGLERPKSPKLSVDERQDKLLHKLDLSGLSDWDPDTAAKAKELLLEYHDIFSLDSNELGCTSNAKHKITLTDDTPFKERFRRIPPPLVEEVRTHLKDMLDSGAIRPSQSPWCNAVVLVRKKDGSLRFCIDFRRLNDRTKKDSYPLPRIQEVLESLVGAGYFSCLDLKSGFWQVGMDEESKQYTAFTVGNMGFFECERMPFGLCNAPATFQRVMQNCLGELNLTYALIYLDDVIVFSQTQASHLDRLRAVFQRFRDQNLKLKPSKCNLFRREITYLAHKITKEGVRPSNENLRAIVEIAPPSTYTEIRGFLGLVSHYRRFIKNFARIAEPLQEYLNGEGAKKKTEKVELSDAALEAVETLRQACISAPILAFADFEKPFLLETDASYHGLGAVLSQKQEDGRYHPVAYGSRALRGGEKNYHAGKLEFLALHWAVTDHFKEYLIKPFTVRTDNNPLTYVMTTPNLDAHGFRWVQALASFPFKLEYQKGRDNAVADALSRVTTRLDEATVKALLDGAKHGTILRADVHDPRLVENDLDREEKILVQVRRLGDLHVTDWARTQREDPSLEVIMDWLKAHKSTDLKELLDNVKDLDKSHATTLYRNRQNFELREGILYLRETPKDEPHDLLLFVVPKEHRQAAINGCHRDAGHQGQIRTRSLLSERFWWPGMERDMIRAVRGCTRCKTFEAPVQRAPLKPIEATAALELVHVDFTSIETTPELNKPPKIANVLVIQDHFTKFVQAMVTPDQTAKTVANLLYKRFISIFGSPERLISDQGANFTSKLIQELCDLLGIKKLRTTAYHPQTNGQVERMNQTLTRMIGKLSRDKKDNWTHHLAEITHAYNSTRSGVTGYSPHFLMFGRRPRLPVDFLFPTTQGLMRPRRVDEYVVNLKDRLIKALDEAKVQATKEASAQKRYYDRRVNATQLKCGDRVLVKADAFQGRRKIKDRWESDIWTVKQQVAGGIPAFVIQNEHGQEKILHRNRLLLITSAFRGSVPLRVNTCRAPTLSIPNAPADLVQNELDDDFMSQGTYGLFLTQKQARSSELEYRSYAPRTLFGRFASGVG